MITCPNCRNQIPDEAVYCPVCGTGVGAVPQFTAQQFPAPTASDNANDTHPPVYTSPVPYVDPYDHTADYDAADIAENKVFALAMYLLGPLGILIALLAAKESRYTAFHVRQSLKLTVAEVLGTIALAVVAFLMWSLRMRGLMSFIVTVALIGLISVRLLCVLCVCKNKVTEAFLVRSLKFLK